MVSHSSTTATATVATYPQPPKWIDAMGHKTKARELAAQYGMPMSRGSPVLPTDNEAILKAARDIGYPVLVKPAGGGGGIGMLPAKNESELLAVVERSRSMAGRGFGNAEVYLERLFEKPRHVEFQILADSRGHTIHLGDIGHELTQEKLADIGRVDIACVPIGGALTATTAAALIAQLDPKIVVAMPVCEHDGDCTEALAKFFHEMGATPPPLQPRLTIMPSGLPAEVTTVLLESRGKV